MGTTAGPAATNATAVGRTTAAAAPPRPPLVPEGADHHPLGSCRPGVPARPGGVGRYATDSGRQHRRSPGGLDDHRPSHDGGSHYRRPTNDDPTNDGAADNDPPGDDGPSGCTDAPADHVRSPASNYGRTIVVRSAGQPIRLHLLRAWRAYLQSGVCVYFDCIPNFDNGTGYMVECHDAMYSMSGGRQGACSYHDGVWRPVYSG